MIVSPKEEEPGVYSHFEFKDKEAETDRRTQNKQNIQTILVEMMMIREPDFWERPWASSSIHFCTIHSLGHKKKKEPPKFKRENVYR